MPLWEVAVVDDSDRDDIEDERDEAEDAGEDCEDERERDDREERDDDRDNDDRDDTDEEEDDDREEDEDKGDATRPREDTFLDGRLPTEETAEGDSLEESSVPLSPSVPGFLLLLLLCL